jgi:hypothetical protein
VNVKKAAPAILPQTVAREEKMNDGQAGTTKGSDEFQMNSNRRWTESR